MDLNFVLVETFLVLISYKTFVAQFLLVHAVLKIPSGVSTLSI